MMDGHWELGRRLPGLGTGRSSNLKPRRGVITEQRSASRIRVGKPDISLPPLPVLQAHTPPPKQVHLRLSPASHTRTFAHSSAAAGGPGTSALPAFKLHASSPSKFHATQKYAAANSRISLHRGPAVTVGRQICAPIVHALLGQLRCCAMRAFAGKTCGGGAVRRGAFLVLATAAACARCVRTLTRRAATLSPSDDIERSQGFPRQPRGQAGSRRTI